MQALRDLLDRRSGPPAITLGAPHVGRFTAALFDDFSHGLTGDFFNILKLPLAGIAGRECAYSVDGGHQYGRTQLRQLFRAGVVPDERIGGGLSGDGSTGQDDCVRHAAR